MLCCPVDKADLTLNEKYQEENGEVTTGSLTCSECGRVFPIIDKIPRLLPDIFREDVIGKS